MYYLLGEKLPDGRIKIITNEVFQSEEKANEERIYQQADKENQLVLIPIK